MELFSKGEKKEKRGMEILTDVMGALLEMGRSYSFVFIASKAMCIILVVILQVLSSFRMER